jgi:hypothetical protein
MPRGVIEEREVVCRHCGVPFVTTAVGKAAWYCKREECDSDRLNVHRQSRRSAPSRPRQARSGAAKLLRDPELHPFLDDLAVIGQMATNITPARNVLRDAVRAVAAGNLDNPHDAYRRLAAVALALAHLYRPRL